MKLYKKKIISLDVETDGLYGDGFAVGAYVFENGREIDRFVGIAEIERIQDPWVLENVVYALKNIPVYSSRLDLRNNFWNFWTKNKDQAIIISDYGSPVESYFFRKCIEDDIKNRQWLGPYPLHEVATMLLSKGIDPDINRIEYVHNLLSHTPKKHHPLDDALVSLLTWVQCQGYYIDISL